MSKLYPIILSGGSGTRLWPLSRKLYPKQFHRLVGQNSMVQETCARVNDPDRFHPPMVVCNDAQRFTVAEHLREMAITDGKIVIEPQGRNTAPAIAVAALLVAAQDPEGILLVLASDHVIVKNDAFADAVAKAATAAGTGALVTFGINPDAPETGFGYIRQGAAWADCPGAFKVDRFVEKPDEATAQGFLADGGYHWNSGMFMLGAQMFLDELATFRPDIVEACKTAVDKAITDMDFIRLDPDSFAAAPSESVDYAVMEKTEKAVVVPADLGWSDVGSWSALWKIGEKDDQGNVVEGDGLLVDTKDSYVRSDGPLVSTIGCQDVVVVATRDAVLVADKDKVQDVKTVVAQLQAAGRPEGDTHTLVHRPWGSYEGIAKGDRFQVKHISVRPGQRLSLQMHYHRAEHWIVVAGTALVTVGEQEKILQENQSIYIPAGTTHRLENPGKIPLELIEVQSGPYLEEDDIVRFEDTYGRVPAS
ncbi:MAG: mannose-1-phosphate guanylyltransferase/mannose-6-phosphate isomerase [Rhodospirillaceae bacterium]